MLVRKLQQCEQRRRQERGIKGEIILIKLAGAGDNDQVTALNAGPKYENQSQKLFLDLGLMLLFRAGRVPASQQMQMVMESQQTFMRRLGIF